MESPSKQRGFHSVWCNSFVVIQTLYFDTMIYLQCFLLLGILRYWYKLQYLSVGHPPYYKGLDYIYEDRGEVNLSYLLIHVMKRCRIASISRTAKFLVPGFIQDLWVTLMETFSGLGFTHFRNRRACTGKWLLLFLCFCECKRKSDGEFAETLLFYR